MFRPQKTWKKTRIKLYLLALPALLYSSENWSINARKIAAAAAADMRYTTKKSGIHLNRLENKYRVRKGIKYNPSFEQNTGLQMKLGTTWKQNAS